MSHARALPSSRTLLITLLLAIAIWLPRGLALDRFVTADEHAWLTRSGNFYRALTRGEWAETFQRHHPGVTVIWAGVAGFLLEYPGYAQDAPGQFGWLTEEIEPFLRAQGHDPVTLLAAGRTFVVLAITLSLLIAFGITCRLFGILPAAAGFALLAFAPFPIGHARLLHLDGLVSSFMLLALVAFLAYLSERRALWLIIAAVATALAGLTRSPALFLAPFLTLTALADWWTLGRYGPERRSLRRVIGELVLLGMLAAAVFVALWPAMWVDPVGSLRQVVDAATAYAAEGHLKPTFFGGEVYAGDPGFWFYPITYLWRSTPITWTGVILAGLGWILRIEPFVGRRARFAGVTFLVYAVLFMLFMDIGAKKFDRYLLPAYLPLELMAGAGYVAVANLIRHESRWKGAHLLPTLLVLIVLAVQAGLAFATYPYYLSYYNPVMGGSRRAPETMMIGWGEGADEAGRYLADRTAGKRAEERADEGSGENRIVASGYTNGPFSYFYPGQTVPIYFWHQADYAVVYAQDWQRQLPSRRSIAYFRSLTPEHVVTIDGLEYAHIFDMQDVPLPHYVTDWSGTIRLVTFQLPAAPISPGESFRAIFYFVNLASSEENLLADNLNVIVRLVGENGEQVARSEGWPWGSPTDTWQVGDVWPDGHNLTIPATASPGYYRVQVGYFNPVTRELLPAQRARSGETLDDLAAIEYLQVGEIVMKPALPLVPAADLDGQVRLLGATWRDGDGDRFEPEAATLTPGTEFEVDLFWQAQEPIDGSMETPIPIDYTGFVHVVGPGGAIATQDDHQPLDGFLPTSAWLAGQIVPDRYRLTLPEDAMPGEYRIYAGMYDLATAARLPLLQNGEVVGDAVLLATVHVK